MNTLDIIKKGWCPSLEKPMETGDGLLVRIPIKFGLIQAEMARKIAALATKYGNGHLDLSARGNLQLRGVRAETYEPLRDELSRFGFERDLPLHIITSPLDKKAQEIADNLYALLSTESLELPEKFLIVIDGGGVFSLSAIPCDLYINPACADIQEILSTLRNIKKCDKKPANINIPPPPIGFIPLSEQSGIICVAVPFGRIEAEKLIELAEIAENFIAGKIIFSPFRRIILPDITSEKVGYALQSLENSGFIIKNADSRLNIYACVGAPACSSALGETRLLAQKWADDFPNLAQTVHITGCSKGCAYKGKADIVITATEIGYDIAV